MYKQGVGSSSITSASARSRRSPPATIASACSTSWAASRATSRRWAMPTRAATSCSAPRRASGGQVLETPIGNIPVYNNVREGLDGGAPLQLRRGLSAAIGRPRRRRRADPRQSRPEEDLHHHREDLGARLARDPRHGAAERASTSSAATASASPTPGTRCASAARSAATIPASRCARARSPSSPTRAASPRRSRTYLRMAGWGTTTADLERQGRLHPLRRAGVRVRARQRRAQQGGRALLSSRAAITSSMPNFTKPVVACVVGRWKSKLTRAVGHAGAMAGGNDDAQAKERWFMEKFGVDGIFTPDEPVFSAKGAVVTNIAHIPAALTAVMRANATHARLRARGQPGAQAVVRLRPGHRAAARSCDLPVVEAVAPYDEQVAQLNRQIGAMFAAPGDEGRLGRLADGCEDAGQQPAWRIDAGRGARIRSKSNVCLALLHEPGGENDRKLINVAVAA